MVCNFIFDCVTVKTENSCSLYCSVHSVVRSVLASHTYGLRGFLTRMLLEAPKALGCSFLRSICEHDVGYKIATLMEGLILNLIRAQRSNFILFLCELPHTAPIKLIYIWASLYAHNFLLVTSC